MSAKTSNDNHNTNTVRPIPKGYESITPHIFVKSSVDAIEFYKKLFGAIEESRYMLQADKDRGRGEKVIHAVLNIGNSKLLLADEFPEMCDEHITNAGKIGAPNTVGGNSVFLNLYFENVDVIFDKAQREGATVVMPLMDAFWGDRGEEYRNCAKDRLCMLLETAKCEQTRMVEHEPHTNRYCAIGALLNSLGYEYKPGQKFASDSKKDISDPHPAILELAILLNIVGIDVTDIGSRNDKGANFRDIQRYIMFI